MAKYGHRSFKKRRAGYTRDTLGNKTYTYLTRCLDKIHGLVQEHGMQQPSHTTWRLIFNACHYYYAAINVMPHPPQWGVGGGDVGI